MSDLLGPATPLLLTAVAALGLCVGSFLNVVIHRVPAGGSVLHPASSCPSCSHPIRPRDNVPVLGWLVLRGRCRDCRAPISVRYPLVELLTAMLFVALTLRLAQLGQVWSVPALLVFASIGVALTMIDLDVHRLPDVIVLPAYPVLAVLLTVSALAMHQPERLVRTGVCALFATAAYGFMRFAYPQGMGFGDVKLAGLVAGVAGYLSYDAALVATALTFVAGLLVAIVVRMGRGTSRVGIPFGPFMVAGAVAAFFVAGPVASTYTRLVLRT